MAQFDQKGGLDEIDARILAAADPDFVFSVDPQLDKIDLSATIEGLGCRPFAVQRLREQTERTLFAGIFHDDPYASEREREQETVFDIEPNYFAWDGAAIVGVLPGWSDAIRQTRLVPGERSGSPVLRSYRLLNGELASVQWAIVGESDDVRMALKYWSLRAVGATPAWIKPEQLNLPDGPTQLRDEGTIVLFGALDSDLADAACVAWSTPKRTLVPYTGTSEHYIESNGCYFARSISPVAEHDGHLRFPTPTPPPAPDGQLRLMRGVAEFRIRSPEAGDPDGIVLNKDLLSQARVSQGSEYFRRITDRGVAEPATISTPQLIDLPTLSYETAVTSPLEIAGFVVSPSDKGLYQQNALRLARGLRFLAFIIRQPESSELLRLFFTYHGAGRAPEGYRRAVTFTDLNDALTAFLRQGRTQLSHAVRARGQAWLSRWTAELAERDLLIAGYVLRCKTCAQRQWYRSNLVDQRYTCTRCGTVEVVAVDAQRSFQLNEAFYQLMRHNGHVVTLALAGLRKLADESFLYLPEVQVENGGKGELDAVALVDGSPTLVEAKSNNSLTRAETTRYRHVADRVRAGRLIFATTARDRPLCAALACDLCRQQGGEHHRDYAWDDGARGRIVDTRARLASQSTRVESWCYEALVSRHVEPELSWPDEQQPRRDPFA